MDPNQNRSSAGMSGEVDTVSDEHRTSGPPAAALAQLIQTSHVSAPFSDDHDDRTGRISAIMRHVTSAQTTSPQWYCNTFRPVTDE